jgi:thiol:disulfide interchange protein DsbD
MKHTLSAILFLVAAAILTVGSPERFFSKPATKEVSHGAWQTYNDDVLAAAKAAGQPVIIDFFADWCVACKELEAVTFSDARVQEAFNGILLLRFDATQPSDQFEQLQKRYGIVGLPYITFIDSKGEWRKDLTLTGFEDAEAFLKRVSKFRAGAP